MTVFQKTGLKTSRTNLIHRIRQYHARLIRHLPYLRLDIESNPITSDSRPESLPIYLPSSLAPILRAQCPSEVVEMEDRLRYGHAYDALSRLRSLLGARSLAYKGSSRVAPSQGSFTRHRAFQSDLEAKIQTQTARYRASRAALLSTRGEGDWTSRLRVLENADVRGISERLLSQNELEQTRRAHERAGITTEDINNLLNGGNVPTLPLGPGIVLGESRLSLSWIWYTHMPLLEGDDGNAEVGHSSFAELQESKVFFPSIRRSV